MATTAVTAERDNYLNQEYGIKSWLLTIDHKRIALLYLLSITFFFFIGGFFALLIRLELLTPAGDLVQADTYNKLFTMHGTILVNALYNSRSSPTRIRPRKGVGPRLRSVQPPAKGVSGDGAPGRWTAPPL